MFFCFDLSDTPLCDISYPNRKNDGKSLIKKNSSNLQSFTLKQNFKKKKVCKKYRRPEQNVRGFYFVFKKERGGGNLYVEEGGE